MSRAIEQQPWQSESDAKLAAMELALKIASGERDTLAQENQRLREELEKWKSECGYADRKLEDAKSALREARQCITQIAWTGMEKSDVLAQIDAALEAKP